MKLNCKEIPSDERAFLERFIVQFRWIFAKMYADTAPHEYVVLEYVDEKFKNDFVQFASFIQNYGFVAKYYTREGYYLEYGDYYYWTMDDRPEDTELINRARLDDYELIENSWFWKGRINNTK